MHNIDVYWLIIIYLTHYCYIFLCIAQIYSQKYFQKHSSKVCCSRLNQSRDYHRHDDWDLCVRPQSSLTMIKNVVHLIEWSLRINNIKLFLIEFKIKKIVNTSKALIWCIKPLLLQDYWSPLAMAALYCRDIHKKCTFSTFHIDICDAKNCISITTAIFYRT